MEDAGPAWMSIGAGSGTNRAADAAKQALASPLLDVSLEGSKGVLFNIVGGSDLSLLEVDKAAKVIRGAVDPEANIIFGVVHDTQMEGQVRITLIATGFTSEIGMPGTETDRDLDQLLMDTKSEEEMDIPSFLRGPLLARRRQKSN
jgi:cell division protein FtsZ